MKHVDFISIISELWESSQFIIKNKHVYGHQDELQRPLTQLEDLNCRMDNEAKETALAHTSTNDTLPPFHDTDLGLGTVTYNDELVVFKIQSTMYTISHMMIWFNGWGHNLTPYRFVTNQASLVPI